MKPHSLAYRKTGSTKLTQERLDLKKTVPLDLCNFYMLMIAYILQINSDTNLTLQKALQKFLKERNTSWSISVAFVRRWNKTVPFRSRNECADGAQWLTLIVRSYAARLRLGNFVKPRETVCFADKYLHVRTDGEMWVDILHIGPARRIPVAVTNAMDPERQRGYVVPIRASVFACSLLNCSLSLSLSYRLRLVKFRQTSIEFSGKVRSSDWSGRVHGWGGMTHTPLTLRKNRTSIFRRKLQYCLSLKYIWM